MEVSSIWVKKIKQKKNFLGDLQINNINVCIMHSFVDFLIMPHSSCSCPRSSIRDQGYDRRFPPVHPPYPGPSQPWYAQQALGVGENTFHFSSSSLCLIVHMDFRNICWCVYQFPKRCKGQEWLEIPSSSKVMCWYSKSLHSVSGFMIGKWCTQECVLIFAKVYFLVNFSHEAAACMVSF